MSANGRSTKQVVHLDRNGFTLCGRKANAVRYSVPYASTVAFLCDYWNVWGKSIAPHRACISQAYELARGAS